MEAGLVHGLGDLRGQPSGPMTGSRHRYGNLDDFVIVCPGALRSRTRRWDWVLVRLPAARTMWRTTRSKASPMRLLAKSGVVALDGTEAHGPGGPPTDDRLLGCLPTEQARSYGHA
jgi:hypothetical protein